MDSLFDLLTRKDLSPIELQFLRDRLNVIEQQPTRNVQVSGSGNLTLWGDLRVDGDSVIDGTLSGGGTIATGGYTLTVSMSGKAVVGSGTANRLSVWLEDGSLGTSYALTTLGDLAYMGSSGAVVQAQYFENTLNHWSYGAETVVATITLPRAPTVGETAEIVIDLYSGANNPVYINTWRLRRSGLSGSILASHVVYGSYSYDPHSDHWSDTITDATPDQVYVLTVYSAFTLTGVGIGSDYRNIVVSLQSANPMPDRLPIGSEDQFLRVSSGVPVWETVTVITGVSDTTSVDLTVTGETLSAAVLPAGVDHNSLLNYSSDRHFLQTEIDHLSTALTTGLVKVTTGTGAISIVTDNSANWNTAYGWGNHASAGYALAADVIANSLLTTRGDIIRRGASAPERYGLSVPAAGTLNYLGVANGETDPSWKSASSNPGAAAAILQSTTAGYLQLVRLGLGVTPSYPLHVSGQGYVNANSTTAFVVEQSGVKANVLTVNTANALVGINRAPAVADRSAFQVLDTVYGAINVQNTTADATTTFGRFVVSHYTKAEEPIFAFGLTSTSAASIAYFGGGSSVFNAVSQISFYTAANTTTVTGTERMRIDSAGLVTIYDGGLVINENGAATGDARAESDTEANMWFLDASADVMYFGGTTNGIQIDKGGDLLFLGTATGYDDLQFPTATGKEPAAGAPTWETFTTNTKSYAFSVGDSIDLQGGEPRHGWKEGSLAEVHAHVTLKTANSSGANRYVKIQAYVAICDVLGTWTELAALSAEITVPNGTAAKTMYLLDLGDVTLTGYHVGMQIVPRVERIAATGGTEYGDDVYITQVGMHMEHNRIYSRTEYAA